MFRSWRWLSVLSRIKRNALRASDFKNILSWVPITVVASALELLRVLVLPLVEFSYIERDALHASDFKNILSWSPITVVASALNLLGILVLALVERSVSY